MQYGRYQIVAELGRGSMGVVYKAHDPQIDRTIALKVLREDRVTSEDFVRRFLKEAMAVGRLSHPGIVTVYDIGQDHGSIYIAMEFLQGTPLDELMAVRRFTLDEIVNIGIQTARALHYAHQHGIIHRDIKPPNIIYSQEGTIRVTDFGIARIEDPNGQQMTQVGEILGTPRYMSPEQVMGQTLDGRSDMFSLGVILYQLTTGKRPFQGATMAAIFRAITQDTPEPPHTLEPMLPEAMSNLIMKLLEKDPANRFPNGNDLIEALQACLAPRPLSPGKDSSLSPPPKKKITGIGRVILAGIGCLIILAGLGGYYYIQHQPKPFPTSNETPGKQPDSPQKINLHATQPSVIPQEDNPPPTVTHIPPRVENRPADTVDPNDLIHHATALSIIISDLPKKETVLKSARELGKVSPRYAEDVKIAENIYNNARENEEKKLDLYLSEISSLTVDHSTDQILSAIEQVPKESLSERQKNAIGLIEEHLKFLQNGDKLSKEKVLDDFSQRFDNFAD